MELQLDDTRSRAERIEAGRALRKAVPRTSHADWEPPADRPDPVATLLASNEGRMAELVPIRHGRMLVSPFTFLRGSAAVMAGDLARHPTTGLVVQVCGDCHLNNFGMFATPERNVVFGLNDFDETLPGPWELDIKRLAASFVVAAKDAGLKESVARSTAVAVTRAYRENMWRHAEQSPLDVWYDRIAATDEIAKADNAKVRARRERLLAKAQARVGDQLFPKLVTSDGGRLRIADSPPLIFHATNEKGEDPMDQAQAFIDGYRSTLSAERRVLLDRYRLQDVAAKVVGVGSVGTRCLIALFTSVDGAPLLLQVKEANQSVLTVANPDAKVDHNGERVVVGQRLMQAASDIFLGWGTSDLGRHFYVRQLRDMKLSLTLDNDPDTFARYAGFCGRALARAHANSGDAASIAGYLGKSSTFDEAMGSFGVAYAAQTVADHAAMKDAANEGRLEYFEEML